MESGVKFGLGWTCNILLIDSAMMVNKTFGSGDIIALWLECNKKGTYGQSEERYVLVETGIW